MSAQMSHSAPHMPLHSIFHLLFLDSQSKAGFNFMYWNAAICFCYVILYTSCCAVSSPSLCFSQRTPSDYGYQGVTDMSYYLSLLLHCASCRLTKYHITNKCTNCMSFILNHFFKHFHYSYMFRQHIAYHHQGAHIFPS